MYTMSQKKATFVLSVTSSFTAGKRQKCAIEAVKYFLSRRTTTAALPWEVKRFEFASNLEENANKMRFLHAPILTDLTYLLYYWFLSSILSEITDCFT